MGKQGDTKATPWWLGPAPLKPDGPRDSTHCSGRWKLLLPCSRRLSKGLHFIRNKQSPFVLLEDCLDPSEDLVLLFLRQSSGEELPQFPKETSSVRNTSQIQCQQRQQRCPSGSGQKENQES